MRKIYWVTLVAFLILSLRIGWMFYSRHAEQREAQQQAVQRQVADARTTVAAYGGDRLTILQFYADPKLIRRGQSASVCYGVSNAKTVRIDPPVEEVWPSISRCIDVKPKTTTTYKLVAEDTTGHAESATASIDVR